jgi:hypothetical protein
LLPDDLPGLSGDAPNVIENDYQPIANIGSRVNRVNWRNVYKKSATLCVLQIVLVFFDSLHIIVYCIEFLNLKLHYLIKRTTVWNIGFKGKRTEIMLMDEVNKIKIKKTLNVKII